MNENYTQFFTATILEWKPLLAQDKYKQIIMDSLSYLVQKEKIRLFGFPPSLVFSAASPTTRAGLMPPAPRLFAILPQL